MYVYSPKWQDDAGDVMVFLLPHNAPDKWQVPIIPLLRKLSECHFPRLQQLSILGMLSDKRDDVAAFTLLSRFIQRHPTIEMLKISGMEREGIVRPLFAAVQKHMPSLRLVEVEDKLGELNKFALSQAILEREGNRNVTICMNGLRARSMLSDWRRPLERALPHIIFESPLEQSDLDFLKRCDTGHHPLCVTFNNLCDEVGSNELAKAIKRNRRRLSFLKLCLYWGDGVYDDCDYQFQSRLLDSISCTNRKTLTSLTTDGFQHMSNVMPALSKLMTTHTSLATVAILNTNCVYGHITLGNSILRSPHLLDLVLDVDIAEALSQDAVFIQKFAKGSEAVIRHTGCSKEDPETLTTLSIKHASVHANWSGVCIYIACLRGSYHSPYRQSIISLLPTVLDMSDTYAMDKINLHKFFDSKFFRDHMRPAPIHATRKRSYQTIKS